MKKIHKTLVIIPAIIALLAADAFSQSPTSGASVFLSAVKKRVMGVDRDRSVKFEDICRFDTDFISKTVVTAYGAAFLVSESARPPGACVYANEAEVLKYQNSTRFASTVMDGVVIELQEAALTALLNARKQASDEGLRISPLDGSIAARRSYADTVRIWNSRFFSGLTHWIGKGRLKSGDADAARAMDIKDQTTRVLEWESRGMFFSTDKTKSILYATAPPGTSQHISMLAFDVVENSSRRVQEIMAANGWFQTISTDSPHFTYLGRPESELAGLGLKKIRKNGHTFWIPDIDQ
jgi:D-alanyl-D-alanine carboxypeptidase